MTLLVSDVDHELSERTIDAAALERSQIERRRGLRVRQHRPVKVFEPTTGRYFGGQTDDVSSTGLRLELAAPASIRPGETLNIHVGLDRAGHALANRRQMMPARVAWVGRSGSGRLTAGVEFLTSIAAHLDAA